MIGEVSQLANDFWILLAMVIYFAAMLSIGWGCGRFLGD